MKTLAPIFIMITCAGCLQLQPLDDGRHSMTSVNQIAANQILYVHHFGGRTAAAHQLKITPTHTSWRDVSSGSFMTIPTKEVIDIKVKETVVRRNNGFGMGMLAGASMGVMFGLSGDAPPEEKSTIAVLGGMGMGILGGMVGKMTSGSRQGVKYRVLWSNPEVPIRRAVW